MFHASVVALEASGRSSVRAELRKLDDMFDASVLGGIDKVALPLFDFSRGRHQQKELIDTVERARKGIGAGEDPPAQFQNRKSHGHGARTATKQRATSAAP